MNYIWCQNEELKMVQGIQISLEVLKEFLAKVFDHESLNNVYDSALKINFGEHKGLVEKKNVLAEFSTLWLWSLVDVLEFKENKLHYDHGSLDFLSCYFNSSPKVIIS